MFNVALKIFFFLCSIRTSNSHDEKDQMIIKLLAGFQVKTTVLQWMESKNKTSLSALELFQANLVRVKDTLLVMNRKKYANMKSLILATNMNFKIGYPYYETLNIFLAVKRILQNNDKQNKSKSKEYDLNNFNEKILFEEYTRMYLILEKSIVYMGLTFNHRATIFDYNRWVDNTAAGRVEFFEFNCVTRNISLATNIIKYSNNMIEFILPKDKKTTVYVLASSGGFENSRKCFKKGINIYIREKTISIFPGNMPRHSAKCSAKYAETNQADIKDYMNKTFVCNKITAKLLIALFHYYSEIKNQNTIYKIKLIKNNEYQFKWSILKDPPIKKIKKYWLKQKIKDHSSLKKIPKFGMIVDYGREYSTKKSAETEPKPIKTRLILLSCGHHLGFELIDEFLTNYYVKYSEPLKCYICKHKIKIIGSYKTVVYKYK